ncbi:MAG: MBOAT family O-acyltransferase [Roseburia inulinivorans]
MLFNSIDFFVFFPVVVLVYQVIPKKIRYLWLLLASYYFYMNWNAKYALLIGFSTIITYTCGISIEQIKNHNSLLRLKGCLLKIMIVFGVTINLGVLFFFKYFDFFLENVNRVLSIFHIQLLSKPFDVMLPVGISFYTFQALGYIIDVYRGEIKAERNLFRYALFVSFFPQLVAGPIERSKNLLEQIRKIPSRKNVSFENVVNGFTMILYGLFLKMVLADRISILVNTVFGQVFMYGTIELVIGAIGFAIQIYCDFGSYSLIAIGTAQVMGFELMENFNTPYFAHSIKDFWRRWHISLSSWLRDYLYIPLGGNRHGKIRKYINIMVTFLMSGLWHGASWNYVIWGGLHGIYQVIGEMTNPLRGKIQNILKINTTCDSYRLWQVGSTFFLTTFAWIFFRADSLKDALYYISRMVTKWNPWVMFDGGIYELGLNQVEWQIFIIAVVVLLMVDLVRYRRGKRIDIYLAEQNIVFRYVILLLLCLAIFVWGEYGLDFAENQFIYFQF